MVTIKREIKHNVEIELNANDLAEIFWSMDSREQAAFFNWLGDRQRLPFQLQAVTDEATLSTSGRWAMSAIGEYAPYIKKAERVGV